MKMMAGMTMRIAVPYILVFAIVCGLADSSRQRKAIGGHDKIQNVHSKADPEGPEYVQSVSASDASRANSGKDGHHNEKITPELDPESAKQFFGQDYTEDDRLKPVHHFSHPYPTVQDSEDFDKDFIKDENNDKGEWQAQQAYDKLRNKLRVDKEEAEKAKQAVQDQEQDLQDAIEAERKATEKWEKKKARIKEREEAERKEKEAAEARERRQKAREEKQAQEKAREERGETVTPAERRDDDAAADPDDDEKAKALKKTRTEETEKRKYKRPENLKSIPDASEEVENRVETLKDCQSELAAARKALQDLLKQREGLAKDAAKANEDAAAASKQEMQAEKKEKVAEDKADAEQKELDQSKTSYNEEVKKLEEMKAELKKAEARLRKFRKVEPMVDDGGGVYRTRSSASRSPQWATAIAALLVTVFVA